MSPTTEPAPVQTPSPQPGRDRLGRPLRDLRVSVTDRCNFRCTYCMPRDVFGPDYAFVERAALLRFEEIARLVRVSTGLGVRKVRLTGGEPLLRRGLATLVGMLADVGGVADLALTTNGALLRRHAPALAEAGLHRVTVSLDSVDPQVFRAMVDAAIDLPVVLDGIAAAVEAGLGPVKLNAVVRRGVNEDGIVGLAAWARDHGCTLRLIEYMDVGASNGWRMDEVVPAGEMLDRLGEVYPLEPLPPRYPGEVASRYRYRDGAGEVGVIASVTRPFCGDCSRARLSAVGELYTCLFASAGTDLRALLRGGAGDDALAAAIRDVWTGRSDRYSELRATGRGELPRVEMSYIGG